jgi:hypothetical protein
MVGNPASLAMVEHHAMLYADLPTRWRCCAAERGGTALSRLLGLCRRRGAGRAEAGARATTTRR